MKTFLELLSALVLLAVVQNVAVALGVVLLIVVVMAATAYPRQAFAFAVMIGLFALAIEQPLACAAGLGAIALSVWLVRRRYRAGLALPAPPPKLPQSRQSLADV